LLATVIGGLKIFGSPSKHPKGHKLQAAAAAGGSVGGRWGRAGGTLASVDAQEVAAATAQLAIASRLYSRALAMGAPSPSTNDARNGTATTAAGTDTGSGSAFFLYYNCLYSTWVAKGSLSPNLSKESRAPCNFIEFKC
jgi:hypothetical protein